jgi:hypothetical protein
MIPRAVFDLFDKFKLQKDTSDLQDSDEDESQTLEEVELDGSDIRSDTGIGFAVR